jgi:peptidoglycan/LPS O-acetylase OafA/YrhL
MGFIRVFLAMCVIATHSAYLFGVPLLDGNTSIEVFYVLSGFLISLVLNRIYKARTKDFYLNRITKIYPAYVAALLLSIVWFKFVYNSHHNPYSTFKGINFENTSNLSYTILVNLLLFGTDTTRFTTIGSDGNLNFLDFANSYGSGGHNILFVPQAWTISIELLFYLLAPFLVRNRSKKFLFFAIILLLLVERFTVDKFNALNIPINVESISIFQIKFFLIGAIASTYVTTTRVSKVASKNNLAWYFTYIFSFLTVVVLTYQLSLSPIMSLILLIIASRYFLPKLFSCSLNTRWDKHLGDLSYPFYIFHYPFAKTLDRWFEGNFYFLLTLCSTLIVSVTYQLFSQRHLEIIRDKIRNEN